MPQSFSFKPIGYCRSPFTYRNQPDRQARPLNAVDECYIELVHGNNYEQALEGLDDCDRIWCVFVFDQNLHWKPMVHTPRGPRHKLGVFATRAPYRPNPIGISCLGLSRIEGRRIYLQDCDLLDSTPVLDIKPYIAYADSFPEARYPWVDQSVEEAYSISFTDLAKNQIRHLKNRGLDLNYPIYARLTAEPTNPKRTRLVISPRADQYCFAYRTWRICFTLNEAMRSLLVTEVFTGYSGTDLANQDDPYGDKDLHRWFRREQQSP